MLTLGNIKALGDLWNLNSVPFQITQLISVNP